MDLLQFVKGLAGLGHATCERASAGRSLAIRQLPNDPASSPPPTARITAAAMTPTVTDGCTVTATTCDAVAGSSSPVGAPGPAACEDAPEDPGIVADFGATAVMIAAPANPRPIPAAAPAMPIASDS